MCSCWNRFKSQDSGRRSAGIVELVWNVDFDSWVVVLPGVWVVRIVCDVGKGVEAPCFVVSEFFFGMVHEYKKFVNTYH